MWELGDRRWMGWTLFLVGAYVAMMMVHFVAPGPVEATTVSVPGFVDENDVRHAPVQIGIPFPEPQLPRPVAAGWENEPRWIAGESQRCYAVVSLKTFDPATREWVYEKEVLFRDVREAYSNVWAVKVGSERVGQMRLGVGEKIRQDWALFVEGPYEWEV